MKWKNFESRQQGKIISFEFPVDIKDTNSYEFNPSMPPPQFKGDPRDEMRVISLQAGLDIGWVHVTQKLGIAIHLLRKKSGVLPNNVVHIGQYDWKLLTLTNVKVNSVDERYLTDMTNDYDLLFWISADKIDEARRIELKKIAQRILESIKIHDDK